MVIGDLKAAIPVIQGGMGVGVSLSGLAGAVSKYGGVGIISTAQIGYKSPEFLKNPIESNLKAIPVEMNVMRQKLISRHTLMLAKKILQSSKVLSECREERLETHL